jgi:hypothetical protein
LEAIQKQVRAIAEKPPARVWFFVSFPSILAMQKLIPLDFNTTIQIKTTTGQIPIKLLDTQDSFPYSEKY